MNEDEKFEKLEEMPDRELHPPRFKKHYHLEYNHKRLKRWLYKQIGRDFNDIYADFKKHEWIPSRHRNMAFLYSRFLDEAQMQDGILVAKGWLQFHPIDGSWNDHLFIHPITNKLTFVPAVKQENWQVRYKKELAEKCIILGDYHQYAKIKGIWYELHMQDATTEVAWDSFSKKYIYRMKKCDPRKSYDEKEHTRWNIPYKSKRQLSSVEMKKYNLKNH